MLRVEVRRSLEYGRPQEFRTTHFRRRDRQTGGLQSSFFRVRTTSVWRRFSAYCRKTMFCIAHQARHIPYNDVHQELSMEFALKKMGNSTAVVIPPRFSKTWASALVST